MKIIVRSVEPGTKRLIGWGAGSDPLPEGSDGTVGYLRRDADGTWVGVDHRAGMDVVRTSMGFRTAVQLAREYFAPRHFCHTGCGRLTRGDLCAHCEHARIRETL